MDTIILGLNNGYIKVVKLLLKKGANITTINNNGLTLLNLALYNGHIKVVKLLLKKGANIITVSKSI